MKTEINARFAFQLMDGLVNTIKPIGKDSRLYGIGLGLLLCKEFVELYGGRIWIECEPGNGSKFKFTLLRYI